MKYTLISHLKKTLTTLEQKTTVTAAQRQEMTDQMADLQQIVGKIASRLKNHTTNITVSERNEMITSIKVLLQKEY